MSSTTGSEQNDKKNKTTNTIELLQKEKPPVILQLEKDAKSHNNNAIKINLGVGIGSSQRKETQTKITTTATTNNLVTSNGTRPVGLISKEKIQQEIPKRISEEEEESIDEEEYLDSENSDLCNVFVKYLPPHFSDEDLRELFTPFGEIVSCHVMTDKTRENSSLGFGFVRFSNENEAQDAIQGLNEKSIGNKRLLCKLSNSAGNKEKDQQSNLFIRNIPPHYDEETLKQAFEVFGPISKVKIMIDINTQRSKCYGFCKFENRKDALSAIQKMNGSKLDDDSSKDILPLVVRFAETEHEKQKRKLKTRQIIRPPTHVPNPYVHSHHTGFSNPNGMNPSLYSYPMFNQMAMRRDDQQDETSQDMTYHSDVPYHMTYFVPHHMGVPVSSHPTDRFSKDKLENEKSNESDDQNNQGPFLHNFNPYYNPYFNPYTPYNPYYHVPMYDESSMNENQEQTHTKRSKNESSSPEDKNSKSGETANLFIFHLPGDVDDSKLMELFSKFGEIESVKVIRDPKTNLSKGYGFVKYCNIDSAMEAVSKMNSYKIGKKHLKVSFHNSDVPSGKLDSPVTDSQFKIISRDNSSSSNSASTTTTATSQPLTPQQPTYRDIISSSTSNSSPSVAPAAGKFTSIKMPTTTTQNKKQQR
ncbi:hypothetical protein NAEGRDRAFT_80404 [Naegleria gruberi]|uniref:Uncharacterized protein FM143 n=1 Tax=Naegleria gruberi TaxID=5762 RepID=D2VL36_NAEGR|nr:uncharacterized protein NAEGRDRAFT_80404 [Naegleria gruberi]EFC42554.1 hypothetical protein NAEGRDRAFT_80404 [Naegleria gruberi]|eukprot:XP_002675298.1 hypothetical protein NAEGRDRAFT_80404 [Naegleria gruberi strain NEG-M]